MVSNKFRSIFFGVSSILIFLLTHEYVHGYVAGEYGCNVSYSFIPNVENFFTTTWSNCTGNTSTVRFLQSVVEIVGYQLFILHSLVTGYVAVQINRQS